MEIFELLLGLLQFGIEIAPSLLEMLGGLFECAGEVLEFLGDLAAHLLERRKKEMGEP